MLIDTLKTNLKQLNNKLKQFNKKPKVDKGSKDQLSIVIQNCHQIAQLIEDELTLKALYQALSIYLTEISQKTAPNVQQLIESTFLNSLKNNLKEIGELSPDEKKRAVENLNKLEWKSIEVKEAICKALAVLDEPEPAILPPLIKLEEPILQSNNIDGLIPSLEQPKPSSWLVETESLAITSSEDNVLDQSSQSQPLSQSINPETMEFPSMPNDQISPTSVSAELSLQPAPISPSQFRLSQVPQSLFSPAKDEERQNQGLVQTPVLTTNLAIELIYKTFLDNYAKARESNRSLTRGVANSITSLWRSWVPTESPLVQATDLIADSMLGASDMEKSMPEKQKEWTALYEDAVKMFSQSNSQQFSPVLEKSLTQLSLKSAVVDILTKIALDKQERKDSCAVRAYDQVLKEGKLPKEVEDIMRECVNKVANQQAEALIQSCGIQP